jgi:AbrB family looped-hinge helix DNA binding protein
MAEEGKRRVQSKGEITLPKEFREENDISPGDYITWKRHSRDKSKLIIEAIEE